MSLQFEEYLKAAPILIQCNTIEPGVTLKHEPIVAPIPRKSSLVATIKKNFASLDRDMVARARGRVEVVIEAGGDFVE